MFAEGIIESYKTESGEVIKVMKTSWFDKTEIPKPRNMKQLIRSLHPDIHTVAPGCTAHEVAVEAWNVSMKLTRFFFKN